MPGSCAPSAGVERGIVKVSRLPKLGPPNDGPKEQLWHYTLAFPFQIAPRLAAVSCTIEQSFRPGQDFLNGADIILFDDLRNIPTSQAMKLSRDEQEPNPNAGGKPAIMSNGPCHVGFVPAGAKLADGSPHPHAGTGFGFQQVSAWPMDDSDLVNEVQRKGRRRFGGRQTYQYYHLYQFAYDGSKFHIRKPGRVNYEEMVPGGWNVVPGFGGQVADGNDLLIAMSGQRPGRQRQGGVVRWRRSSGAWRAVSFDPVTEEDTSTEPSMIRDLDGEFLFCARGTNASGHPMRVWKSRGHGSRWDLVIFVGGISSSPVAIYQAADGTPYLAANRYQYQTHIKGVPSLPYFRGPDGKPRPDGGTRETLLLWPINEARNAVEIPIIAKDCLAELGPPPHGSIWAVDHPSAMTLQLRDGEWHNVIGYRLYEKEENTEFTAATRFTGAYLNEVFSAGKAIPTWSF
jgi:hypothetical protein